MNFSTKKRADFIFDRPHPGQVRPIFLFCFCCFFFSFLFDVLRDITNWFLFKTEHSPVLHFLDHLVTLTRDVYTYTRPCPDRTYTCHIVTRERSVMTYLAYYTDNLIPQSILSLNDYIILLLKLQLSLQQSCWRCRGILSAQTLGVRKLWILDPGRSQVQRCIKSTHSQQFRLKTR